MGSRAIFISAILFASVLGGADAAFSQPTKDKWCVWYRRGPNSSSYGQYIQMLNRSYPACGGTIQEKLRSVPRSYTLWVWCAANGCQSARQALHDHFRRTKQVPDWRGQVR